MTIPISIDDLKKIQTILTLQSFTFCDKPYMHFFAQKPGISISAYKKGPKILIQGKNAAEFIHFHLEPFLHLPPPGTADPDPLATICPQHIGIDESGKGDFLGPLVIAGVYVDQKISAELKGIGVCDSKKISSDNKIALLANQITYEIKAPYEIIVITPKTYNQLYAKIGNLNKLLAWGHAKVLENLLTKVPDCSYAISDQFAKKEVLQNSLQKRGKQITLIQQPRAESDSAVAAASILARHKFLNWMADTAKLMNFDTPFPKGVSAKVENTARQIFQLHGVQGLTETTKSHFITTQKIINSNTPNK